MTDVFISYAHPDQSYAEQLEQTLARAQLSAWWDRNLTPGAEYDDEIEGKLRAAKCVIVIWSEHAAISPYVKDEARLGRDLSKLLPLRVPDFDNSRIPLGFGAIQTLLVSDHESILERASALAGRPWNRPQPGALDRMTRAIRHVYYAHRWPIISIAGLLLAVGLGFYVYRIETGNICEGTPVEKLSSTLWNNLSEDLLDNAQSQAEQLLRCDKASISGLAGMGAVSFYRANYKGAVEWFRKALNERPGHFVLTINLADSLTADEQYSLALDALRSLPNTKDSVLYRIGRTHLLAGDFGLALAALRMVPTSHADEARRGKARILQAAALVKLSEANADEAKRAERLAEGKAVFLSGVEKAPQYWRALLLGNAQNIKEPFNKVRALFGSRLFEWLRET